MINNINDYVATQLRKLRAEKNITLMELAEKTRIDIGALIRYEKGLTSIKLDKLAILLNYYEVSFQTFFNLN